MIDQLESCYQFAPLEKYTPKRRLMIKLISFCSYHLMSMVARTTRFEVVGSEFIDAVNDAGKVPIFAFWHDRMFFAYPVLRNSRTVQLVSQSFDGEYTSRILQKFGLGVVRGSSSTGGSESLRKLEAVVKERVPAAFTVDGPRGPTHVAKAGPAVLALRTGDPVIPFHIAPKRFFKINSWDKMLIPLPFSKALVSYGEPIYVDSEASRDEVTEKIADVQSALDQLTARGCDWSGEINNNSSDQSSTALEECSEDKNPAAKST